MDIKSEFFAWSASIACQIAVAAGVWVRGHHEPVARADYRFAGTVLKPPHFLRTRGTVDISPDRFWLLFRYTSVHVRELREIEQIRVKLN